MAKSRDYKHLAARSVLLPIVGWIDDFNTNGQMILTLLTDSTSAKLIVNPSLGLKLVRTS